MSAGCVANWLQNRPKLATDKIIWQLTKTFWQLKIFPGNQSITIVCILKMLKVKCCPSYFVKSNEKFWRLWHNVHLFKPTFLMAHGSQPMSILIPTCMIHLHHYGNSFASCCLFCGTHLACAWCLLCEMLLSVVSVHGPTY